MSTRKFINRRNIGFSETTGSCGRVNKAERCIMGARQRCASVSWETRLNTHSNYKVVGSNDATTRHPRIFLLVPVTRRLHRHIRIRYCHLAPIRRRKRSSSAQKYSCKSPPKKTARFVIRFFFYFSQKKRQKPINSLEKLGRPHDFFGPAIATSF